MVGLIASNPNGESRRFLPFPGWPFALRRPSFAGMRVLAISGSLRTASTNTAVLEAAALVAPPGMVVEFYRELGILPHFNPDLDGSPPPPAHALRAAVGSAGALLLSTPEYAHGLPGSFKNALDWLVGSTEFPGKPVAVINLSARSTFAAASLNEILRTMSARLVEPASITLELPRRTADAAALAADPRLGSALRAALHALAAAASP